MSHADLAKLPVSILSAIDIKNALRAFRKKNDPQRYKILSEKLPIQEDDAHHLSKLKQTRKIPEKPKISNPPLFDSMY
jgi:uncharacterized protein YutE (UPF0331/DUF86 family)